MMHKYYRYVLKQTDSTHAKFKELIDWNKDFVQIESNKEENKLLVLLIQLFLFWCCDDVKEKKSCES